MALSYLKTSRARLKKILFVTAKKKCKIRKEDFNWKSYERWKKKKKKKKKNKEKRKTKLKTLSDFFVFFAGGKRFQGPTSAFSNGKQLRMHIRTKQIRYHPWSFSSVFFFLSLDLFCSISVRRLHSYQKKNHFLMNAAKTLNILHKHSVQYCYSPQDKAYKRVSRSNYV